MSIDTDKKTLVEIISAASNTSFKVPNFQRDFVWKKAGEVEEFWQDLEEQFLDIKDHHANSSLFLGNLILCAPRDSSPAFEIIDGQQRMTTIFILLIAFRSYLRNLRQEVDDQEIKTALNTVISNIDSMLIFSDINTGKMEGTRFEAAKSVNLIIDHMCQPYWDEEFPDKIGKKQKPIKRQCNKVKPIYDYFRNKIEDLLSLKSYEHFTKTINTITFIEIALDNYQEAYLFFERTNARGKNLEVGDLLKAHLFANHPDENDILDIWDQIVLRSSNQLTRMLKYFYITHNGHITASKLFNGLKNLYTEEKDKSERVIKLVVALDEFSYFFEAINKINDEQKLVPVFDKLSNKKKSIDKLPLNKIYHAIDGLNLFGITQATPLIWSFLSKFHELKLNHNKRHGKTLVSFFENLENYHFINNHILDRVGNEVEKLYASYARDFSKQESDFEFTSLLQHLYRQLKDQVSTKEEFVAKFKELEYVESGRNIDLYYIFDRFNNVDSNGDKVSPSDRQKIYHAYIPVKKTDIEIEHWFPQAKAKDTNNKVLPWCHNIGNLMALTRIPNNKLGSKTPQEKYKYLKEQPEYNTFNHNKRFMKEYAPFEDWDENRIRERAEKLAEEAYTKIWKFEPPPLEPI